MSKRLKLGLIFSVNDAWIGGTYYILNLISTLKSLPEFNQPIITVLSKNESDFLIAKETGYPFLHYKNPYLSKRSLVEKVIDKVHQIIFKKYIIDKRISAKDIDVLFPANNEWVYEKMHHKVYWFADFQHIVYPSFFSEQELINRNALVNEIAKTNHHLVLSSYAAKADWDSLPILKNCKVHVIPFAVTHPPIQHLLLDDLLEEFNIGGDYFIVSNQFWVHKNHLLVLKALQKLVAENISIQIVFTGKEDDYRHPGYFKTLTDFINFNSLTAHVKLLGLIDRKQQLKLMQGAKAVIQPSFFEGWSTVVEDAKSLGCTIIASNIDVHKEQLGVSGLYFDPYNENELVESIKKCLNNYKPIHTENYKKDIELFGQNFLRTIEQALQSRD